MKKTLTLLFVMLVSAGLFAQQTVDYEPVEEPRKLDPTSLTISAGYVPKAPYKAFRFGVNANNLVNRFGAYTGVELGTDSDYLANTLGITATVHRDIYLWGGVDLFTKHGLLNKDRTGWRKEFGVGYIPHNNLALKVGWSLTVGFTFQVGFRIPLMKVNP